MANLIESFKDNPVIYYLILIIAVVLLIIVFCLIIENEKNKKEKLRKEQEEKERVERQVDLEAMIAQMQEEEQNKLKDVDPVANFENEQEEQAIISYQELVNAVKTEGKETIPVTNVNSVGEVISTTTVSKVEPKPENSVPKFLDELKTSMKDFDFSDFENKEEVAQNSTPKKEETQNFDIMDFFNDEDKKEQTVEKFDNKKEEKFETAIEEISSIKKEKPEPKEHQKFKNTEFISPIYGRQNSNITYPTISSRYDYKNDDEQIVDIDSEVDMNEKFLKTLQEYRNE